MQLYVKKYILPDLAIHLSSVSGSSHPEEIFKKDD